MDIIQHHGTNGDYYVASRDFELPELKLLEDSVQSSRRNDGAKYCVSPFALTWDNENYYMIGYDSDTSIIIQMS